MEDGCKSDWTSHFLSSFFDAFAFGAMSNAVDAALFRGMVLN
jgi:hypothetical protein